jgi:hypothetical protein
LPEHAQLVVGPVTFTPWQGDSSMGQVPLQLHGEGGDGMMTLWPPYSKGDAFDAYVGAR